MSKRPLEAETWTNREPGAQSKQAVCLRWARAAPPCGENETLWMTPGPRAWVVRGTTVLDHATSKTSQDVTSAKDGSVIRAQCAGICDWLVMSTQGLRTVATPCCPLELHQGAVPLIPAHF